MKTINPPRLINRGDGVRDHYCIGRQVDPGDGLTYWEFYNKGEWVSAGEVFIGRDVAAGMHRILREQRERRLNGSGFHTRFIFGWNAGRTSAGRRWRTCCGGCWEQGNERSASMSSVSEAVKAGVLDA